MAAQPKLAKQRLTLLPLAEVFGIVSEACRRRDVSRSQFYEHKLAFQEGDVESLRGQPPIPKTFLNETPRSVKKKIVALWVEHTTWGQVRVSGQLQFEGVSASVLPYRETSGSRKDPRPATSILRDKLFGKPLAYAM